MGFDELFYFSSDDRIEEDPIWKKIGSKEFKETYLSHEIPAVANIAACRDRSFGIYQEVMAMRERLNRLLEDQGHNNLLPAELFRLISELRIEVVALRNRCNKADHERVQMRNRTADLEALLKYVIGISTFILIMWVFCCCYLLYE